MHILLMNNDCHQVGLILVAEQRGATKRNIKYLARHKCTCYSSQIARLSEKANGVLETGKSLCETWFMVSKGDKII